ncbi:UIM domain-containing and EF hand-containing [Cryptosporidium hominis]
MNSFGATNGQGEDDDDLELQRALSESLREFNNTNNILKNNGIQTLDENNKQSKDDNDIEFINNSVTFNDLINYSESMQNELVNILNLNNKNFKKKNDIDSLTQIITGKKVIDNKLHEHFNETYDPYKDKELKPLPIDNVNEIIGIIFGINGNLLAQDEDIKRWIYHSIEFTCNSIPKIDDNKTDFFKENRSIFTFKENFTSMNYCLIQQGGGPCGVLASLNGFIISQLIFNPLRLKMIKEKYQGDLVEYLNSISEEDCWEALIQSICMIFFQSSPESKYRVIQYKPYEKMETLQQNRHFDLISNCLIGNGNNLYYYVEYDDIMEVYKFYWRRLKTGIFSNIGSLFSILVSIVGSRTPNQIRLDMDDFTNPLVGMFGHCSQELVNLFITGSAVSNVFDGVKILNDNGGGKVTGAGDTNESLSLKGIYKKSILGYLTEHEALQYCKVGLNYKYPLYPIWIIVNKNHYKCSFSFNFNECILTISQEFIQVMQKAFEKFDTENSGFIFDNQLEKFLNEINLKDCMFELKKFSENGIILWNDLKKCILNLVGIENEEDNQLRGSRTEDNSLTSQYKLWTSVYIFDGQNHIGKKLIISTIFPLENYSRIKKLYDTFSSNHKQNDNDKRKSIEELDLISILQTRWGGETVIETKILNL